MMKSYLNNKGNGVMTVILIGALIVFVLFPVFSIVFEKYLISIKGQQLKDAIDITNIAAYNALKLQQTAKTDLYINSEDIEQIYSKLLIENLKLNEDMTPCEDSIAEGQVRIEDIEVYSSNFPVTCPLGRQLDRLSVHSVIVVPVKPSLYRGLILSAMGKENIELIIHVDSEIPINN